MTDNHGPVELRSAVVEAVAYPERLIDIIAVPYDEWTTVPYRGRFIEESVAPGAFGAVETRFRRRINVNLEHDPERWIGRLLPSPRNDATGLRVRVKVRRTDEGDQALNDAADGMLGASVGMAVGPHDQTIDGNRRRITKAYLDHVALTAQPAYVGAEVIDVRSAPAVQNPTATPNLDRILAQRRAESYSFDLT